MRAADADLARRERTHAHSPVSGLQAKVAAYGRPLLRRRNFFGVAKALAEQFPPQHRQAEQSAAEQRNCRAAIGNSRRSNADVVQKEEASSAKLYRRRGAQSGESKRELGVAR